MSKSAPEMIVAWDLLTFVTNGDLWPEYLTMPEIKNLNAFKDIRTSVLSQFADFLLPTLSTRY